MKQKTIPVLETIEKVSCYICGRLIEKKNYEIYGCAHCEKRNYEAFMATKITIPPTWCD